MTKTLYFKELIRTPAQIRTAIKGLEDLGPSIERQGHSTCVDGWT